MRIWIFIFGFALGFSLDVTVQAAERVQLKPIDLKFERAKGGTAALLEEPKACLDDDKARCALRVGNHRQLVLTSGKREWTFAEKSIAIRLSADRLRLIEGSLRIRGEETVVETEQGELMLSGEAFVDRNGGRLTVVNTGLCPGPGFDKLHGPPWFGDDIAEHPVGIRLLFRCHLKSIGL